ncbi:hypothetical protein C9374_013861 [Naegleria lovaniensis]|uniref:F-box domain-containing protein n=1 Tax=Naegleria lovaniensis TaxID=51637 RepID=A0AA88H0A0_NAELO|nr:uncharacterized protein C9374_013861 [Naegleria lovaniensis]KAG2389301.1 hypothetical protein C9374_013861 [Naegleria lovaniensis]
MKKRLLARILPSISEEEETRSKSLSELKHDDRHEYLDNEKNDDDFENNQSEGTNDHDEMSIHEDDDEQFSTYWDEIPCDIVREICNFLFPLDYLRLLWLNKHWNGCVLSFTNTVKEFRFTKYIYDKIMKTSFDYSEALYEGQSSHSEELLQSQYMVFKKRNELQVKSLFRNLFNNISQLYFSDLFIDKELMIWCLSGGRETTNGQPIQDVNTILHKLTFFNCKLETGLAESIARNASQLKQIHLPYTGFFSMSKIFEKGIRYDVFQTQYISFLTLKRALSSLQTNSLTMATSFDAQASEILGNIDFDELRPFFCSCTNLSFETLKYIFLETYNEISESYIPNVILEDYKPKLEQENSETLVFKKNNTFYTCAVLPDLDTSIIIPLDNFDISIKSRKLLEKSASSISSADSSDEEEEEELQFGRKKTLRDYQMLQSTVPNHMSLLCYCEIESFKDRSDSITSYIEAVSTASCYIPGEFPCVMVSYLINEPCTFDSILEYCNSIQQRNIERSKFTLVNYYGIENHSPIYGHLQRLCDTICWGDTRHVEYLLNMGFHVHDLLFNTTLAIESSMTNEKESYEYFVADFMISLMFFGIVHSQTDSRKFIDLLHLLSNFGMQKLVDPLLHELTHHLHQNHNFNFDHWSTLDLLICLKLYRCMLSFSMIFPVLNSDCFIDIESDHEDFRVRNLLNLDHFEANLEYIWSKLLRSMESLITQFWARRATFKLRHDSKNHTDRKTKKSKLSHPNTAETRTKREQPMRFTKILKLLQNAEATSTLFGNSSSSQKTAVDEKLFINMSFWNFMLYREQCDERYDHISSTTNGEGHQNDWNGILEELDFDWFLHCDNEGHANCLQSLFYRIGSDPRFESPLLSAILNCNENGLRFLMDYLPTMNENYRTERFEEWLNYPRYYEGTRSISMFDMIHNNNILLQMCDALVLRPILIMGRWLLCVNQADCENRAEIPDQKSAVTKALCNFIVDVFFEGGLLRTLPGKEVNMSKFLSRMEAKKKLPSYDMKHCYSISEDRRLSMLVYLTQLGAKSTTSRKSMYRTK